jgi:chemotaxis protein CheZ
MSTTLPDPERYRAQVLALVGAMESGNAPAFRHAFDELCAEMDSGLLPELKRITAKAQSALARFSAEARLDAPAGLEVPDARKRLTHVVKLTDEAAHRTLDLVELCGPLVDEAARGRRLLECSNRRRPRAGVSPARAPTPRRCAPSVRAVHGAGHQDITGQIIRSVNALVDDPRRCSASWSNCRGNEVTSMVRRSRRRGGSGPWAADRRDRHPTRSGQDDIDALLSQMAAGK